MTPWPLVHAVLLADRGTIFREMGDGFREKRDTFEPIQIVYWILAISLVCGVLGLLAAVAARTDQRRRYHSPWGLFRALCNLHELDRRQRSLLKQLAQLARLSEPGRLFVEPEFLRQASTHPAFAAEFAAIGELQRKLFATPVDVVLADGAPAEDVPGDAESRGRGKSPQPAGQIARPAPVPPASRTPLAPPPPYPAVPSGLPESLAH